MMEAVLLAISDCQETSNCFRCLSHGYKEQTISPVCIEASIWPDIGVQAITQIWDGAEITDSYSVNRR